MSALRVIALSPLSGATPMVTAIVDASSYRVIIGLTQACTASTSNGSPIPYQPIRHHAQRLIQHRAQHLQHHCLRVMEHPLPP
jgi:hypothetical protein